MNVQVVLGTQSSPTGLLQTAAQYTMAASIRFTFWSLNNRLNRFGTLRPREGLGAAPSVQPTVGVSSLLRGLASTLEHQAWRRAAAAAAPASPGLRVA